VRNNILQQGRREFGGKPYFFGIEIIGNIFRSTPEPRKFHK